MTSLREADGARTAPRSPAAAAVATPRPMTTPAWLPAPATPPTTAPASNRGRGPCSQTTSGKHWIARDQHQNADQQDKSGNTAEQTAGDQQIGAQRDRRRRDNRRQNPDVEPRWRPVGGTEVSADEASAAVEFSPRKSRSRQRRRPGVGRLPRHSASACSQGAEWLWCGPGSSTWPDLGPASSGLAARLGLPVLRLDDFYKDGDDPTLPRITEGANAGLVDWDHPNSGCPTTRWPRSSGCAPWEAPRCPSTRSPVTAATEASSSTWVSTASSWPRASLPRRSCPSAGLVASSRRRTACASTRSSRSGRLTRDLREHRKPPLVLLRRGLALLRDQRRVVDHAVALGCRAVHPTRRTPRCMVMRSAAMPDLPEQHSGCSSSPTRAPAARPRWS